MNLDDRYLLMLTNFDSDLRLISKSLYKSASSISGNLLRSWDLESLFPIPYLSVSTDVLPIPDFVKQLQDWSEVRCVLCRGSVELFSGIGSSAIVHGRIGASISPLLKALVSLDRNCHWIEANILQECGENHLGYREFLDHFFYPLFPKSVDNTSSDSHYETCDSGKDPSIIGSVEVSTEATDDRYFVVLRNRDADMPIVSADLYRRVLGVLDSEGNDFFVESIVPLPVLSLKARSGASITIRKTLESLQNTAVIVHRGLVDFEAVGARFPLSFGSSGEAMSLAVVAGLSLPRIKSWLSKSAARDMPVHAEELRTIGGEEFYAGVGLT